jgi:hypothetical protein
MNRNNLPAEADFREAITLAQKMDAKGRELRTSMSLAKLLAKQGARTMLAEIYDSADLKDA